MNDSGGTEQITQDPAGLANFKPTPVGRRVEGAGGIFLPVAGYGRLCLLVDQGTRNFMGPTHELALKRVAYVPNLGKHNLISMKQLAQSFDAGVKRYT